MSFFLDPFNLLLLAIAGVILWRLNVALGTRTGNERPPFDPYAPRPPQVQPQPDKPTDNVVVLPRPGAETVLNPVEPPPPVWKGFAPEGSPLAQAMGRLAAADPGFTPKAFLVGAKAAYEMIIDAFAKGDKSTLKPLLSRDVMAGFAGAIDARAAAGQTVEQRFVGIDSADFRQIDLNGGRAQVTVQFVSQVIAATLAKDGSVVEGDRSQIRSVSDEWTFERDINSRDPNWKLVATRAPT